MLRSPKASEGSGGALGEAEALRRGNTVGVRDQVMVLVAGQGLKVSRQADNLLPTVTTSEANGAGVHGDGGQDLRTTVSDLLPTPSVAHLRNHDEDIEGYKQRRQDFIDGKTLGMPGASLGVAVRMTDWGKFAPAVDRWEQLIGRAAPAPTKPDGKDDAHRLSSEFTEWMMGLPAGWITGVGLSRNEELKACGNGVVPQQAELALRNLLDGVNLAV